MTTPHWAGSGLQHHPDLARETKQAPPKRWRNKWNILVPYKERQTGRIYDPGIQFGANVWPSKDVAETRAAIAMAECPRLVWLGAFPVEEGE